LATHPLRIPLPIVVLLQGIINFGVAVGLGLLLARKVGLGAPILEQWIYHRGARIPSSLLLISCGTGVLVGLLLLGLVHSPVGAALSSMPVLSEGAMPVWKRFLACFYGGLCEEIVMRLFLLSLVIWLLRFLVKARSPAPAAGVFWAANFVVALAFGAGHLPLAAQLGPLTPQLIAAVLFLNGIAALPFGYLYWSRGLEAAMLAHFSADLVLHVIGPTLPW
ncbi:MAG TPA: CPBP family glutamic-type intramembrane protease, partial [Chthoniobacterales bacterium]